jgi:hypothetical protein
VSDYPLAALLALREQELEAARATLAAAHAAEVETRRTRDDLARAAAALAARCDGLVGGAPALDAAALQEAARFAARLRREATDAREALALADERLAEAVAVVAEARAAVASADRAREVIGRHRQAWEGARRRASERRDDAAQDDLAAARAARERDPD